MAQKDNNEQYMYVRSITGDNRVALHEVDEAHPGGSAMVAGNIVVKVGRTALVLERIRNHMLMEVKDNKLRSLADRTAKAREEGLPDVDRPDVPGYDDVDEEKGEITAEDFRDNAANETAGAAEGAAAANEVQNPKADGKNK